MNKTIERKLSQGITVRELIERLNDMPEDAIVLFTCDYGDHCHTIQALPVSEVEELGYDKVLVESSYSQSGMAVNEVDDEDYGEQENPSVVLLS